MKKSDLKLSETYRCILADESSLFILEEFSDTYVHLSTQGHTGFKPDCRGTYELDIDTFLDNFEPHKSSSGIEEATNKSINFSNVSYAPSTAPFDIDSSSCTTTIKEEKAFITIEEWTKISKYAKWISEKESPSCNSDEVHIGLFIQGDQVEIYDEDLITLESFKTIKDLLNHIRNN